MAEKTIYTCDICRKETTESIPKGRIYYQLSVGALCYTSKSLDIDHYHVCYSCLDKISEEVVCQFDKTICELLRRD